MKRFSIGLFLAFAIFSTGTVASVGCSSSKGGGSGGGDPVTPNADGYIAGTDPSGILGAWYSYGDWYGGTPTMAGNGDCPVMGGFAQADCSMITTPAPGQPFANTGGNMCTSGTVAKVIMMSGSTTPAYSAIWGAGIGFDMNNGGTDDGGTGIKQPYDAVAHGVTGFSFDLNMTPVGGQMRVEFPTAVTPGTTDINAAYWGGASANLSPPTKGGTFTFHWKDVGGPMYLPSPTAFDPSKILSMQFHVVANTSSAVPFDFCISNLKSLTD